MSKEMQSALKSYLRAFIVSIVTLYAAGEHDWKMLLLASAAAVIAPAIRAIDKNDAAFGMVADLVKQEIDKLAKADKKKSK